MKGYCQNLRNKRMMLVNYRTVYEKWLNDPIIDQQTKNELKSIANNESEIEDRFFKDLEFGTGGLRGVIGAGSNRLNVYTIRKATQGLANYILGSKDYKPGMGVAIAHDCRRMSPEFSMEAALVLNANSIKTYVFDSLRPTPLLSFAVRHLGCIAGIVITASHNPPEYNGYKVYWADGGQCTFPKDEAIIQEVDKVTDFSMVKTMELEEAKAHGIFNVASPEVDIAFTQSIKTCNINPSIIPDSDLKIVYTPLHGAGNVGVRRVLSEVGFKHVYVVPEQEKSDGEFPTVAYPNPEEKEAYNLALDYAAKIDADIVIATDPDADRVGVAVKHDGKYILLSGNMTGVILTEYLLSQLKVGGRLPQNSAVISTIVSTNMAGAIAKNYGVTYLEVLTGFKYIGEKIREFEESGSNTFIFGFEESYGYLSGTYTRDKDAIAASMLVCEAAAYYRRKGLTLYGQLLKLYEKHGLYKETIESITLKGVEGLNDIKRIMSSLRECPPQSLGGSMLIEIRDYLHKQIKILPSGQVSNTDLPVSDVLYYAMEDGSWACIRPSGTEPKIKIYFGVYLPAVATMCDAEKKLKSLVCDMKSHI